MDKIINGLKKSLIEAVERADNEAITAYSGAYFLGLKTQTEIEAIQLTTTKASAGRESCICGNCGAQHDCRA